MAQYTRLEVIQQIKESGMVPLFYHKDINVAKAVLKACYDGGARLMEFTSRGDFSFEIFNQLIKYAIEELGKGTIRENILFPRLFSFPIFVGIYFIVRKFFHFTLNHLQFLELTTGTYFYTRTNHLRGLFPRSWSKLLLTL